MEFSLPCAGFAALALAYGQLLLTALVVIQFESQNLTDAAGAVQQRQDHGGIPVPMERALVGGFKADVGICLDVPEGIEGGDQLSHVLVGRHVLVRLGGFAYLIIGQGVSFEQVVPAAPFGKDRGTQGVMMQHCLGLALVGAVAQEFIEVSLGELRQGQAVLVCPAGEGVDVTFVEKIGCVGASGFDVDTEAPVASFQVTVVKALYMRVLLTDMTITGLQ